MTRGVCVVFPWVPLTLCLSGRRRPADVAHLCGFHAGARASAECCLAHLFPLSPESIAGSVAKDVLLIWGTWLCRRCQPPQHFPPPLSDLHRHLAVPSHILWFGAADGFVSSGTMEFAFACVCSLLLLGEFQEEIFKPGSSDKTALVFNLFSASYKFYLFFCCSYFPFN